MADQQPPTEYPNEEEFMIYGIAEDATYEDPAAPAAGTSAAGATAAAPLSSPATIAANAAGHIEVVANNSVHEDVIPRISHYPRNTARVIVVGVRRLPIPAGHVLVFEDGTEFDLNHYLRPAPPAPDGLCNRPISTTGRRPHDMYENMMEVRVTALCVIAGIKAAGIRDKGNRTIIALAVGPALRTKVGNPLSITSYDVLRDKQSTPTKSSLVTHYEEYIKDEDLRKAAIAAIPGARR